MKGVLFLGNRSLKLEDFPSIQKLARGREALPAQTARVLPGTQNQAPPDLASNALDPAMAQPLVRLARRSNRRDAADLHRLAPPELPVLLAPEVPSWLATDSAGTPSFDPQGGA